MSLLDHAVALFGYDRALLDELSPRDARRLRELAALGYLPVFAAGAAAGLLVWMSERDPFWTPAIALFVALLVFNLLRLNNSGGGPAPHQSVKVAERWAPGAGGVLVLGVLGALSAQPWLAWGSEGAQHAAVEAHRATLTEAHRTSLALANAPDGIPSAIPNAEPSASPQPLLVASNAEDSLARCGFVALRLRLLWKDPEAPLLATAAFVVMFLSPLLLGHLTHLGALRRYHQLCWTQSRSLVLADESVTQQLIAHHLGRFPGPIVSHLNVVPAEEAET